MFWVISVYFNIRNTLLKSGTFLLGHPVYIYSSELSSQFLSLVSFVLTPVFLSFFLKGDQFYQTVLANNFLSVQFSYIHMPTQWLASMLLNKQCTSHLPVVRHTSPDSCAEYGYHTKHCEIQTAKQF